MASGARLILVEHDLQIREEFRGAMEGYSAMTLVYETDRGCQALDYLSAHPVQIMILDIELAAGDGLSLLTQLWELGLEKPFVFAVTNTQSSAALSCLRSQGADYIYQKSNQAYSAKRVLGIIDKIYPYHRLEKERKTEQTRVYYDQRKADEIAMQIIEQELEEMGFRKKHVGFRYAADAIFLMDRRAGEMIRTTSEIYPLLAEKYHTTRDGVERGIRNAIEAVFVGGRLERVQKHYPFPFDEEKGRPSNAEFLKNMASRINL